MSSTGEKLSMESSSHRLSDAQLPKDNECVVVAKQSTIAPTNKTVPTSRWGHTLSLVSDVAAIMIGGQGDKNTLSKDAIFLLDIERSVWTALETSCTSSVKPEVRMGHTAIFDPLLRCIYLFGGSKNTKWFSDVQCLDVDDFKWRLISVNGKAPTRAYHSCTMYCHELWIFGGIFPRHDPEPDACSNDVFVFSPIEESWYAPLVTGPKPLPRSGHSATLLNNKLIIFGGWEAPICYNDLHILDLSTVEWLQPKVSGTIPAPRSWHSSCALTGNRILIHGGYNGNVALNDSFIFDLDNLKWTSIKNHSTVDARTGHAAICLPYHHDKNEHDEILIFGGGDNNGRFFNDLITLSIPFTGVRTYSKQSNS